MIMVTGATGFLGAHVLFELVSRGESVQAMYRQQDKITNVRKIFGYYTDDINVLWNRIVWIHGDVLDYFSLLESLANVTEVYHAAGMVSFDDRARKQLELTNVLGTANLVNACMEKGVYKFCHVSSIATLGESDGAESIDENMIWNPGSSASAYAISKLKGEMEVWRGIHEGLKAVIVNPSVIIGPGMWLGSARQLLEQIKKGLRYYPDGTSGYVDVRDTASAMVRLMEQNCFGERFIINAENISHRQVLNYLADAMKQAGPGRPITPFLTKTAVIAESIRAAIAGQPPRITRRALEIASEKLAYSNKKVSEAIAIRFTTIEESCKTSMPLFLAETGSAS
jgi:dihydroflavonol-4-reductase